MPDSGGLFHVPQVVVRDGCAAVLLLTPSDRPGSWGGLSMAKPTVASEQALAAFGPFSALRDAPNRGIQYPSRSMRLRSNLR